MAIVQKIKNGLLLFAAGRRKIFCGLLLAFFLGAVLISMSANVALGQTGGSGWNIGNYGDFQLPSGTVKGIIENLLKWLLLIFGFIGIIGFVISGIMYLVSAGDEEQQKRAKRAMYYSIIGVIVGLVGYVVLQAAAVILQGASPEI